MFGAIQVDCDIVKIDVQCAVKGDVVMECINLEHETDREEMMFRIMFNTAFIRSNILILTRDDIDIMWNAKERYPKDFRAEVSISGCFTNHCFPQNRSFAHLQSNGFLVLIFGPHDRCACQGSSYYRSST